MSILRSQYVPLPMISSYPLSALGVDQIGGSVPLQGSKICESVFEDNITISRLLSIACWVDVAGLIEWMAVSVIVDLCKMKEWSTLKTLVHSSKFAFKFSVLDTEAEYVGLPFMSMRALPLDYYSVEPGCKF